jgi:two-component system, OmpR family, response regulator RegX3
MQPTVLIVDDEPTVREMLAEALTLEGFQTVVAADGAAALTRVREARPDLVRLDLMLPGMPGLDVCREIRRDSSVPIIMLTAKDSELDKVLGLELGADDYVTKPFSLREVAARIRAVLRRREERPGGGELSDGTGSLPERPRTLRFGPLEIDLAGHEAFREGRPLSLKPRAFELLAFLAGNAGQVFTREQLLRDVWGTDYPGETRTVDIHVHQLREQLEEDPAYPVFLQTVRGTGYVFRPPR